MTENVLQPTGDQVRAFRDRATGEPISMLNLLRFKPKAVYEDGRESDLSGKEAYQLYGEAFNEIMGPKGARVVYSGEVRGFLIGEGGRNLGCGSRHRISLNAGNARYVQERGIPESPAASCCRSCRADAG